MTVYVDVSDWKSTLVVGVPRWDSYHGPGSWSTRGVEDGRTHDESVSVVCVYRRVFCIHQGVVGHEDGCIPDGCIPDLGVWTMGRRGHQ